ncbi:cation:dicarboxylate symporter family transporter [Hyalangium sp.]|uniref:cation:dicarboxylate symporter family transporter n=1 Tax=Hyalangium sp. TaxID=2028555 RepID=UPI002D362706|nr:cation:dicarboxylase symporter family transporter [Hyalangium sp.]HYI00973.1 cation:dicarboxylase symporter family transporter [Hyalangium sp.]
MAAPVQLPPSRSERYAALHALVGLSLGLGLGWLFPFTLPLTWFLEAISSTYGTVAPILLYLILAPSLLKVVRHSLAGGGWFPLKTLAWFAKARLAACLLAIAVVSAVYQLPLLESGQGTKLLGLRASLGVLGRTMTESPYFFAIYASFGTVLLLWKRQGWLIQKFVELPELVETLGRLLTRVTPLFTLLMGLYIVNLPAALQERFQGQAGLAPRSVPFLGGTLEAVGSSGILWTYLALSLLTGILCLGWHLVLLLYVKLQLRGFSILGYLRDYLARIYPLLWSTCSEALAMPLNLYLIGKHYPGIQGTVRQFTVGAGSVLSTNGTLMCCFAMIPAVGAMVGVEVSVTKLLLCLPVIYILGFGVPGIPGELVLFAGPIMSILSVPGEQQQLFLLAFIGLQAGLPDSFRTGANATESCPAALLLSRTLPASGLDSLLPPSHATSKGTS